MGEVLKFVPRNKGAVSKILAQDDDLNPNDMFGGTIKGTQQWAGQPNSAAPKLTSKSQFHKDTIAAEWVHILTHQLSEELERAHSPEDKFNANLAIIMSSDEEASLGRMDIYGHSTKTAQELAGTVPFVRVQANYTGEEPPLLSGTRTEMCQKKFLAYMDDWILRQGENAEAPVHALLPGLIMQIVMTQWYGMVVGYSLPPTGSNGRARIVFQDLRQTVEWSFSFDMALVNQDQG